MKHNILFVEDRYVDRTWMFLRWLPAKIQNVMTCTTAEQALSLMDDFDFTHVFLDHDLDWIGEWPEADNGMDIVDDICKWVWPKGKPKIIVHSTSAKGGHMLKKLLEHGFDAQWLPFETKLLYQNSTELLNAQA